MTTISIGNLQPGGMTLFTDSESYLDYLSKDEEENVLGGGISATLAAASPWAVPALFVSTLIGSFAYALLK